MERSASPAPSPASPEHPEQSRRSTRSTRAGLIFEHKHSMANTLHGTRFYNSLTEAHSGQMCHSTHMHSNICRKLREHMPAQRRTGAKPCQRAGPQRAAAASRLPCQSPAQAAKEGFAYTWSRPVVVLTTSQSGGPGQETCMAQPMRRSMDACTYQVTHQDRRMCTRMARSATARICPQCAPHALGPLIGRPLGSAQVAPQVKQQVSGDQRPDGRHCMQNIRSTTAHNCPPPPARARARARARHAGRAQGACGPPWRSHMTSPG